MNSGELFWKSLWTSRKTVYAVNDNTKRTINSSTQRLNTTHQYTKYLTAVLLIYCRQTPEIAHHDRQKRVQQLQESLILNVLSDLGL